MSTRGQRRLAAEGGLGGQARLPSAPVLPAANPHNRFAIYRAILLRLCGVAVGRRGAYGQSSPSPLPQAASPRVTRPTPPETEAKALSWAARRPLPLSHTRRSGLGRQSRPLTYQARQPLSKPSATARGNPRTKSSPLYPARPSTWLLTTKSSPPRAAIQELSPRRPLPRGPAPGLSPPSPRHRARQSKNQVLAAAMTTSSRRRLPLSRPRPSYRSELRLAAPLSRCSKRTTLPLA